MHSLTCFDVKPINIAQEFEVNRYVYSPHGMSWVDQKNRQTDRQTDRNTNIERMNTTTIYKLQLNTCSTNFVKRLSEQSYN